MQAFVCCSIVYDFPTVDIMKSLPTRRSGKNFVLASLWHLVNGKKGQAINLEGYRKKQR